MIYRIILAVFTIAVVINCDFLPSRLRIVDRNTTLNNFIVRGNLPIRDNKF